ncbi:GerMN domain-containing protein [Paenibacillus caui]|uniref:GerMN domain-containing protein n=1 Tax=Paenibacillus caui TaxID=2873927 RepID=UPI001CA8CFAE|nr:GerMN domain-containing protein [Paenibacillus caui]
MKVLPQWRMTAAAGALALPLLLSGCTYFGANPSPQIDPPPAGVEEQMLGGETPTTAQVAHDPASLTTVYLENGQGLLAPVSLPLGVNDSAADDQAAKTESQETSAADPKGTSDAKETSGIKANDDPLARSLEVLVKDGPYQSELPSGFSGVLPAGTEVKVSLNADQKLAVVEFSKEFEGYDAKDERKILEAVTWTLTEEEGVNAVEIWVDGQRLNEMPADHTPLTHPLNRSVGINLELNNGTSLSRTTAVTVYFTATSEDGDPYFVPVTRFVPVNQDPLKAALGQLIQGPIQGDGLEQVLTETASVKSVESSKDGIVNVALNDDMFESGERIPAQMLQAVVLTVTENSKGSKVRITFNDNRNVVDSDNRQYSDPVTRPEKINDLSV